MKAAHTQRLRGTGIMNLNPPPPGLDNYLQRVCLQQGERTKNKNPGGRSA